MTAPSTGPHTRRRRRIALRTLALVLALAGVGTMLYPTWVTHRSVTAMHAEVAAWQTRVASASDDDLAALIEAMRAYNAELAQTAQVGLRDPFSYEQPGFDLSPYGIDDDVVGRLRIARLDLDAPVVLGGSAANLDRGVALLGQTSLPVGGGNNNVVLAGHRAPGMLWDVEQLTVGDIVEVTNARDTLTYRVVETEIITPDAIDRVLIQPGRDLITLVTCHPLRENYQRYVVRAERVGDPDRGQVVAAD